MARAGTARQVYANKASAMFDETPNPRVNICGKVGGSAAVHGSPKWHAGRQKILNWIIISTLRIFLHRAL